MRYHAARTTWAVGGVVAALISGAAITANANANTAADYTDPTLPVNQRVTDLLGRMTLPEKVGQMTQVERGTINTDPTQLAKWGIGSVFSGGGSTPTNNTPAGWADMVDTYQSAAMKSRLRIPLIYGIDAVHGNGNLKGATLFPHQIGIGATRDPEVAYATSRVTAQETRAVGIPWVFGPCLCLVRDDRWGRGYEAYGEDPALVVSMERAIDGLQGKSLADNNSVLSTIKHFAGDGDTTYGSGKDPEAHGKDYPIDQGIVQQTKAHVMKMDLAPYIPAVRKHNAGSMMPSYSSIDYTDDQVGPVKMHANHGFIQRWFKDKVGFDGFVVSDYNAIEQVPPTSADSPTGEQIRKVINAGVDMVMGPTDYQKFHTRLIAEVEAGRISKARIDDAVRRILTKKFQLGLFEEPMADRSNLAKIGSPANRAVARNAAAKSQVLLRNMNNALPLRRSGKIYVAGRNADDLGNQTGGWSITWQGMSGKHTTGTTILEGMRQVAPDADITYSKDGTAPTGGADTGVVVVGETPYAEGWGDVGGPSWSNDPADNGKPREPKSLSLNDADEAVVKKVCSAVKTCVVLVVSGRTQVVTELLPAMDGLIASWLPGTEGAGVADVLFGVKPFTGKLPVSWPKTTAQQPINTGDAKYDPLYKYGHGLTATIVGN